LQVSQVRWIMGRFKVDGHRINQGFVVSFNLLTENWIPVLRSNGHFDRIGIRSALIEAGRIRQIAASNPMDNVSLLRFLLAVLLWCRPGLGEADHRRLDGAAGIPPEWLGRLEENRAAFDLLGEGARFYQDASLKDKKPRPIADLLVEFPGADSVNHMRHVMHDGSYGFCPACCALGILRLSVWAPANGSYPASVNPGSGAYAILDKECLLATLLANLPQGEAQADHAPWMTDQPPASPGAVACLAWRPRKLWLNVPDNGHCAYCGQPGTLVKSLCIAEGWPTPVTAGQQFGKDVLGEFQKLSRDYKARATDRRKLANKVVKIAPVILKCRMASLVQADSNATQARQDEGDAAKIARIFDHLYTSGNHGAIKEMTKKPTEEERSLIDPRDTQVKKFWIEDPHLLKETEPIGLPDLGKDVAMHASRFWRDALRLHGTKGVAVGIVGDGQYIFHDAFAVTLPDAASANRASLTEACAGDLHSVLRTVTPNPKRMHPEINAALVLMAPDTEARIRATLNKPDATTDDTTFLHETYEPLVEHVVTSTAPGSPLRRREASARARTDLDAALNRATATPQPASSGLTDGSPASNPPGATRVRRARKKKGAAS
jgi:hypothetical protein